MEAVFPPENDQIFPGGFLSNSCAENRWKKSEKIPTRIQLAQNHRNYLEPAVSRPGCLTWEIIINMNQKLVDYSSLPFSNHHHCIS